MFDNDPALGNDVGLHAIQGGHPYYTTGGGSTLCTHSGRDQSRKKRGQAQGLVGHVSR